MCLFNAKKLWEWGAGGVLFGPELADGGDVDPGYDGRIVYINSLHFDSDEEAQSHLHLPVGHPQRRRRSQWPLALACLIGNQTQNGRARAAV